MSIAPPGDVAPPHGASSDRNKFSTLPDIDLSSVDVYETASSPELKPTKHTTTSSRRGGRDQDDEEDEDEEDGEGEGGDADGNGGERRRDAAQRRRRRGDGAMDDDDPTRASIEGGALDAEEARQRFQGSTEVRRQTVARRRPRRQPRHDDYLDSDVYELEERGGAGGSARGTKETPLARLRRLKMEAKELEEELRSQAAAGAEGEDGSQQVEEGGDAAKPRRAGASNPTPQVMLSHLRSLASGLDAMDINGSATGTMPSTTRALEQARTLLASLEKQGTTPSTEKATDQLSTSLTTAPPATSGEASRLSSLESRLSLLESIVGSNQGVLEETQSLARPLMPTLARLEHLATLLTQPRHLDAISKRVKLLVADLDRVYEARRRLVVQQTQAQQQQAQASGGSGGGGGKGETATAAAASSSAATPSPATTTSSPLDPITLTKLSDLFHLSQRLQPLLPLAPALLARLESLSQLHGSAARFADDLETLQRDQADARERLAAMGRGVEEVRESLRTNAEQARGNLRGVEERLEGLSERLGRLDERRAGRGVR